MADMESRLAELEARVRLLEDELAIQRVIAAYGMAADSGDAGQVEKVFAEDSLYEVDGMPSMVGHKDLREMILGQGHQSMLPNTAHTFGPAIVKIDGDRAVMLGYTRTYYRQERDNRLWRLSYTRLEFERRNGRWQITRRANRLVGRKESQDMLRKTLSEIQG